jgi:hypothetical protein
MLVTFGAGGSFSLFLAKNVKTAQAPPNTVAIPAPIEGILLDSFRNCQMLSSVARAPAP